MFVSNVNERRTVRLQKHMLFHKTSKNRKQISPQYRYSCLESRTLVDLRLLGSGLLSIVSNRVRRKFVDNHCFVKLMNLMATTPARVRVIRYSARHRIYQHMNLNSETHGSCSGLLNSICGKDTPAKKPFSENIDCGSISPIEESHLIEL